MAASNQAEAYLRLTGRRWTKGDVYAPRDLAPTEMRRWRKSVPPTRDYVDELGFNPLDNYRVGFPNILRAEVEGGGLMAFQAQHLMPPAKQGERVSCGVGQK